MKWLMLAVPGFVAFATIYLLRQAGSPRRHNDRRGDGPNA
jgi:hypothetical protein